MELWLDHLCLFAGLAPIAPEPREPDAVGRVDAAAPASRQLTPERTAR